ncbi:APC family permease [Aureivirga marina]|uniref:APC family permease n=1 Tax=Aureivirga marina TaxID=1182451 RepID=UPI0018C8E8E6|nr:APC family permease [Aureivirga marina]
MNKKIGLGEAISIGIGGMVGGGIFAVLGLAVHLAEGGTPIAFFFAGIIALITSYSYVKLSIRYPSRGGTVKFIYEGFGKSVFSGGINNLLWISYIIMISLYASAFGSYAPNLFLFVDRNIDFHIYASFIIALATFINYYSIKVVSEIESFAVVIKLIILLLFVVIGIYGLFSSPSEMQLYVSHWESPLKLIAGGMVIFVAYEGFELIANAAPDIKNPKKNIPKAYYYSVILVILIYVIIATVTVGSLPFEAIENAKDYVLAEAARPTLGKAGFIAITIAALISTFSAINVSLYGSSRVSYEIAEEDELPKQFTKTLWKQPIGLMITTIATLIITNFLDIESISTAGSTGFLLIFAMVNYVCFRKYAEFNGNRVISFLGFILCLAALFILINQQLKTNKTGVIVVLSIIGICFVLEWIYKKWFYSE